MKVSIKWFLPIVGLLFGASVSAQSPSPPPQVQLETSKGIIILELNPQAAPKTAANFLTYVNGGFYNNTVFHRVIPGFMIQGGGFTPAMLQKATQAPIPNEADNGLKNSIGTIAMARTNDPHSATAQFFINVSDNAFLDHKAKNMRGWGYCVFGRVLKGMDVVKTIEKVPTAMREGHGDVPVDPVLIIKATVLAQDAPTAAPKKE